MLILKKICAQVQEPRADTEHTIITLAAASVDVNVDEEPLTLGQKVARKELKQRWMITWKKVARRLDLTWKRFLQHQGLTWKEVLQCRDLTQH